MPDDLRLAVQQAIAHPRTREVVEDVYVGLAAEIARQKPLCVMSGRCCHFETYGHRLYVTTLELAAFVSQYDKVTKDKWNGQGCPFQVSRMCGVHASRPFGCRVYFCDMNSDAWQREVYERFHVRIKRLHESLAIPYFYVEWRDALRQLGVV